MIISVPREAWLSVNKQKISPTVLRRRKETQNLVFGEFHWAAGCRYANLFFFGPPSDNLGGHKNVERLCAAAGDWSKRGHVVGAVPGRAGRPCERQMFVNQKLMAACRAPIGETETDSENRVSFAGLRAPGWQVAYFWYLPGPLCQCAGLAGGLTDWHVYMLYTV